MPPPDGRPRDLPASDAGVCAWRTMASTSAMRVLYVLVSILSVGFPGTIVYIILWIVIPEESA